MRHERGAHLGSASTLTMSTGTQAGRYVPCIRTFSRLYTIFLQDLKDFGREAGNVSFSDIDRDVPGRGYVNYFKYIFLR